MAEIWPGAERGLVDLVQRGEPAWEKLAIDDAFGKTINRAEAEAERQFIKAIGDKLLVARAQHRQAVAHDDPIGGGAVELTALAARIPHHLGIMALAGHGIGGGIDGSQHVEIEETVIDRRHQRVGHRMRQPHQIAVVAGRIDHDEIESTLNRADGIRKLLEFRVFVVGDLHGLAELDAAMHRKFKAEPGAARPRAAVVDVAGKALLAAVEIDGGDALAGFHQSNCNMQGGGGFTRSPLFVSQHHNVRRA